MITLTGGVATYHDEAGRVQLVVIMPGDQLHLASPAAQADAQPVVASNAGSVERIATSTSVDHAVAQAPEPVLGRSGSGGDVSKRASPAPVSRGGQSKTDQIADLLTEQPQSIAELADQIGEEKIEVVGALLYYLVKQGRAVKTGPGMFNRSAG